MFVDSHCHLSFPELAGNIDRIRLEMQASSVDRALCICTTLEEFDTVHALATRFDNFWCTAGVHPDNEGVDEPTVDGLIALGSLPRVVGIGETGLDYYRLAGRSVADMEWQRQRFRAHIRAAMAIDRPLVIHTRSASDDTLQILRDEGGGRVTGVFHCFTETREVARAALDLGFMISFSGILTFRNASELRDSGQVGAARSLPGRDRQSIPGTGPVPRQDQLARLRPMGGQGLGRSPWIAGRGDRADHLGKLRTAVSSSSFARTGS
jgi:TatD DNase family protein